MTQESSRSRTPLFVGLGLVLLTLAVYQAVQTFPFISFDDGLYVTGNRRVGQGLTWSGFLWAWQANVASNWHPLTLLSHMLDVELYGMEAGGHHVTNLLFHLANVWLLFEVVRRMTGRMGAAAFVAAVFGVHPTHVESVAWIAERKDVLSGFFFLLTLLAWHRFVREPTPRRYAAVALLLTCGLLSKPMLVTLPCVLLLLDVWPLGRLRLGEIRSVRGLWEGGRLLLLEKVPFFFLAAASSAIALFTQQGSLASLEAVPLARRVANALVSCVSYVGKTFWPEELAVFYPLPSSVAIWKGVGAAALLAVITGFAIWRLRRQPFLAVGWFWFLGMLVPVIGLVQVGRQAMADRYTYLPSIGLSLAVTWGVLALVGDRRRLRPVLACVAVVAVGLLAVTARAQVRTWNGSLTLFRHALTVTENNYVAHLNVAIALSRQGKVAEAEAMTHFREALRIQPNLPEGHSALATALQAWGRPAEALPHAQRAVRLRPNRGRPRLILALVLADLGRKDEALVELRQAVERSPALADDPDWQAARRRLEEAR